MKKFIKLEKLLTEKVSIDDKIQKLIISDDNTIRFLKKKFVGELGEYYFKKYFEEYTFSIDQNKTSNARYDFIVKLNKKGKTKLKINSDKELKVEVKTRYDQDGINHIFGIDTNKFDLLAFIKLDKNYVCDHIGIVLREFINPDKQKRIRYTDVIKPITIL
jgi:hypothetical protein